MNADNCVEAEREQVQIMEVMQVYISSLQAAFQIPVDPCLLPKTTHAWSKGAWLYASAYELKTRFLLKAIRPVKHTKIFTYENFPLYGMATIRSPWAPGLMGSCYDTALIQLTRAKISTDFITAWVSYTIPLNNLCISSCMPELLKCPLQLLSDVRMASWDTLPVADLGFHKGRFL